jgi:hypothetical protein
MPRHPRSLVRLFVLSMLVPGIALSLPATTIANQVIDPSTFHLPLADSNTELHIYYSHATDTPDKVQYVTAKPSYGRTLAYTLGFIGVLAGSYLTTYALVDSSIPKRNQTLGGGLLLLAGGVGLAYYGYYH